MLIAQLTDTHIKAPGKLAYGRVDTASMLAACVRQITTLDPQPDLVVITGDLVDLGRTEEYDHLRALLAPLRQRVVVVAGNHDDRRALRAAFRDHEYLPDDGFLHYAVDDAGPVRIVGLDTLVPSEGRGELCTARLQWLDRTLSAAPSHPTLLLMHHPPFATGIAHMDALGLTGREEFAAIAARHPQVQRILAGHLHRMIYATVGGRAAMTCPSTAHQVALDLRDTAPSCFRMEPPGFILHRWDGRGFTSHLAAIGDYPGPYPFFDPDGRLID